MSTTDPFRPPSTDTGTYKLENGMTDVMSKAIAKMRECPSLPETHDRECTAAEAFRSPRLRELRVKIRSLAEEAKIIRREERNCRDSRARCRDAMRVFSIDRERARLHDHRTVVVRREARYSLLAYAMLRGRPFLEIEPGPPPPKIIGHTIWMDFDFHKLADIARRFSTCHVTRESARRAVVAWLGANSSS